MDKNEFDKLISLIGELGHLVNLPRADFHKTGVQSPVTIGTFTTLAAQIAFLIASAEGANASRAATMSLFSMLPNARTLTLEYLTGNAVDRGAVRKKVVETQLNELPANVSGSIIEIVESFEGRNDSQETEALIAYEGYRLASAYFDSFYSQLGYKTHNAWIKDAENHVKTNTGKDILAIIKNGSFVNWWISKTPFN